MKTLKTCKTGCGKMAKGGVTKMKKVKKLAKGGTIYGIPQTGTTNYSAPTMKKGGSTFGMLSVKAGIDKNPKPTAADRIAGAKMKKGTLTKKQLGGPATPTNPNPTRTLENVGLFVGGGIGTALAARKQNQPMTQKKKEKVLAKQQKRATRKSK
jgi:hypothetical protein